MSTEERFRTPSDGDWQRASDVLYWLAQVTGDPDVKRISDLLDDTMREWPADE